MKREELDFKSVIFKVFFIYLIVYLLALIFRYNYDIESLLKNIQYKYLIVLNLISIFLGLPFSIIFDFVLIKLFGLSYILRKINLKIFRSIFLKKKLVNHHLLKTFESVSFRSFYILIIRSFPILPHILGSYIIASSKIRKKYILIYTFLGSFFYYVFLYLIIWNV